jgi:NO-binding membrane sensor protein with MHYT domain
MLEFPQIYGSQTQLWKSKCQKYFEMYKTKYYMGVKVATMHFKGRAALWLQDVERNLRQFS